MLTLTYSAGCKQRWLSLATTGVFAQALSDLVTIKVMRMIYDSYRQWRIHGDWATASPKTYESSLIHHDFVQFGKQHIKNSFEKPFVIFEMSHYSWYKAS